ncbi:MAG: 50S ribosomal protein L9 [Actinomycetaceae bacterium]|nr:50S ribosomal protein L9 [Actinomycetaceae bacterium]
MAKLILTHDVPNLGQAGEVVTVKDGYARNYLVPRRLAERWTPGAQKALDQIAARARAKEIANIDDAREVRDKLQELSFVEIFKLASTTDALYGAVKTGEIASALKEATGVDVDRRKIVVDKAIKYVGDYTVTVNLHPEVSARVKVRVSAK